MGSSAKLKDSRTAVYTAGVNNFTLQGRRRLQSRACACISTFNVAPLTQVDEGRGELSDPAQKGPPPASASAGSWPRACAGQEDSLGGTRTSIKLLGTLIWPRTEDKIGQGCSRGFIAGSCHKQLVSLHVKDGRHYAEQWLSPYDPRMRRRCPRKQATALSA